MLWINVLLAIPFVARWAGIPLCLVLSGPAGPGGGGRGRRGGSRGGRPAGRNDPCGPGRPGGPRALVLAGAADPGPRRLPDRPSRVVAGRAGQLVVREPAGTEPDRDRSS